MVANVESVEPPETGTIIGMGANVKNVGPYVTKTTSGKRRNVYVLYVVKRTMTTIIVNAGSAER